MSETKLFLISVPNQNLLVSDLLSVDQFKQVLNSFRGRFLYLYQGEDVGTDLLEFIQSIQNNPPDPEFQDFQQLFNTFTINEENLECSILSDLKDSEGVSNFITIDGCYKFSEVIDRCRVDGIEVVYGVESSYIENIFDDLNCVLQMVEPLFQTDYHSRLQDEIENGKDKEILAYLGEDDRLYILEGFPTLLRTYYFGQDSEVRIKCIDYQH